MHDSLYLSVADILRRYRTHDLTPSDVIEAHIARIEAVNHKINALVTPMFDSARTEARQKTDWLLNEHQPGDDLQPFFGVPVTIKDCWAVQGVRFTAGSWYRRNHIADVDSQVVAMLREAGAIILGKSNCPDMSWLGETTNPIFGRTNNPHHLDYMAGGSSGGEGALIGAGASPFGVGSDIAGSVRHPAAATGCVSLKPTAGRIPTDGHVPKAPQAVSGWNTAGLMARRIEDLAHGLALLSDRDTRDYQTIDIQQMPLLVYTGNIPVQVDSVVTETVQMAASALLDHDMTYNKRRTLPMTQALLFYAGLFNREVRPALQRDLGGGEPYSLLHETWRNLTGRKRITGRVMLFDVAMAIFGRFARLIGFNSFEKLDNLRQQFVEYLDGGVLLLPVFMHAVPKHGWTYRSLIRPPFTPIFNALGFPGVVLPICRDDNGLPLAVQIVAPPGDDEKALAVAAHLERVFGGWQPAEKL